MPPQVVTVQVLGPVGCLCEAAPVTIGLILHLQRSSRVAGQKRVPRTDICDAGVGWRHEIWYRPHLHIVGNHRTREV